MDKNISARVKWEKVTDSGMEDEEDKYQGNQRVVKRRRMKEIIKHMDSESDPTFNEYNSSDLDDYDNIK